MAITAYAFAEEKECLLANSINSYLSELVDVARLDHNLRYFILN